MWGAGGAPSPRAVALATGCLATACLAAYEWRRRQRRGNGSGGHMRGRLAMLVAAMDALVGAGSAPWHEEDDDTDLPEVSEAGGWQLPSAAGCRFAAGVAPPPPHSCK